MSVRDVRLHAVQPPAACLVVGGGEPDALLVPAAAFLGERQRGHRPAGRDARQEVMPRLLVGTAQQGLGGQGDGGEVRPAEQRAARLLEDDAEIDVAEARAAVLLRDGEPLEAEFAGHPPPDDGVVPLEIGGQAAHVRLVGVPGEERADDLAQFVLFLAEGEIHPELPVLRATSRAACLPPTLRYS